MTVAIATAPPAFPDLLGTSPADLLPEGERHDSTPDEARKRAERLRAGIVRYSEMRQDIADAYACRDWLALGYNNWPDYVECEFGEQLAQLARGERRQAIQDLRGQGMSTRQIASATGVDAKTVRNDLAQVGTDSPPAMVTGSDGKSYTAFRAAAKRTQTPEPAAPVTASPAGSGTAPTAEHERPAPPKWDPAERRQHEDDVQRLRDIEAGRRHAASIVTNFTGAVVTIVAASRLGEPGLVTADMIRELREAIDLLEGEL